MLLNHNSPHLCALDNLMSIMPAWPRSFPTTDADHCLRRAALPPVDTLYRAPELHTHLNEAMLLVAAAGTYKNSLSSKRRRCRRATTSSMLCWAAMTTMHSRASRLLRRQRLSPSSNPKWLQSASPSVPPPSQRWVLILQDHMELLTSKHACTLQ